MKPDWNKVTYDHVVEACAQFDAGLAVPRRLVHGFFVLVDGQTYPAPFLRRLAYKVATGVELNGEAGFSNHKTVSKFFATLGFRTESVSPRIIRAPEPQPVKPPAKRKRRA